jgi:hypothetical protein
MYPLKTNVLQFDTFSLPLFLFLNQIFFLWSTKKILNQEREKEEKKGKKHKIKKKKKTYFDY